MRYNTIVFDLDGTLLNTLEDLCDSVNVIMERFGWKTHSLEEIRRFVGNGIGKLMERATPEGRKNPQFEEAFEAFRAYYTDHCQIKTRAYDGVVDLMNELKENGAKLAIVSNKNDAAVKELNEIYFSGCVSAAMGKSREDRENRHRMRFMRHWKNWDRPKMRLFTSEIPKWIMRRLAPADFRVYS